MKFHEPNCSLGNNICRHLQNFVSWYSFEMDDKKHCFPSFANAKEARIFVYKQLFANITANCFGKTLENISETRETSFAYLHWQAKFSENISKCTLRFTHRHSIMHTGPSVLNKLILNLFINRFPFEFISSSFTTSGKQL